MSTVDELFCKKIPITIKSADKDNRKTRIHVAVEVHHITTPIHRKELVVRLTDENDLFFLYTLHLNEDDFQSLKTQQGLLVDFGAFPQNFTQLLQMVLQEEHHDSPKFIVDLVVNGSLGSSTSNLNVIETNPFKHLTHLSLKFLVGSDADIKKYLAQCLQAFKDQNGVLLQRLEQTESDLSSQLRQAREALSARTVELDALKSDWSSKTSEFSNKHAQDITTEREKSLQMQTSIQQRYEREKRDMEQSHQRTLSHLETKNAELESTNKELMDRKYSSESTVRELRSKLSLLEEEHHRAKQEMSSLRQENSSLDSKCHEQDKVLHQMRTRIAVLEQEVKDKEEVMQRTSDLLGTEQDQKKKYEDEVSSRKRHIGKLESTVKTVTDELTKANEIIKRLQGEIKNYHTKMKLRVQVSNEQEKLLTEKNKEMEELRRELQEAKLQLQTRTDENKKLNESLEATMQKLDESKQLLKTNENVINWLNKQINETQGSRGGHGPFEMPSAASSAVSAAHRYQGPVHNFSAPQSYGAPSYLSSTVSTTGPSPISNASSRHQVHFNPSQLPRKNSIPVSKSSPHSVATSIPEEVPSLGASPALQRSKQSDLAIDAKYLQAGDEIPLRKSDAPGSRSTTPVHTSMPSNTPPHVPANAYHRGVAPGPSALRPQTTARSTTPNTNHPPLASNYFPSQSRVT